MNRQSAVVAFAVGIVATTWVLASERATFILTNGERVGGVVVFHTEERTNIRADTRQFTLGTNDGKEVYFQFDQVAVIDFVAGRPPMAELDALKPDSHMIVMRDGGMRQGRLIDLIGGDMVRWQNEGGGREDVPIRNVRRVYMSTSSARSIFNYQASNNTGAAGGGSNIATTPPIPDGEGIVVNANTPWTSTGVVVQAGELIKFSPVGTILFGRLIGQSAPAAGNPTSMSATYPIPSAPVGTLIGRVGTGAPFVIGFGNAALRMPARGALQVGINDDVFDDNSGGFRVQIARVRR